MPKRAADSAAASTAPIKPIAAPNNGDWSEMVSETPEGGFVMGNPNAPVKLVEYGSMTCPHCAEFEEAGATKPLIDKYVKTGQVSFEFRNYVRDPFDITATLIARCGGPSSFFGLTRGLFAEQKDWIGKIQAAPPEQQQALMGMPPAAAIQRRSPSSPVSRNGRRCAACPRPRAPPALPTRRR